VFRQACVSVFAAPLVAGGKAGAVGGGEDRGLFFFGWW